jgi:hypothetical protein
MVQLLDSSITVTPETGLILPVPPSPAVPLWKHPEAVSIRATPAVPVSGWLGVTVIVLLLEPDNAEVEMKLTVKLVAKVLTALAGEIVTPFTAPEGVPIAYELEVNVLADAGREVTAATAPKVLMASAIVPANSWAALRPRFGGDAEGWCSCI